MDFLVLMAGNASALICLSTLSQDDLNTALAQISFVAATDFGCTGTATPQNYSATIKTQPIWNKIKNLGVIAATGFYSADFYYSGVTAIPYYIAQYTPVNTTPGAQFLRAKTALANPLEFYAVDSGLVKSFVALCRTNNNGTYDGAYTGTVSDFSGSGDLKFGNPNLVAGASYFMNQYEISPPTSLTY